MRKFRVASRFVTILLLLGQTCLAAVERKKFSTPNAYLTVEILDDDLVHFEVSAIKPGPAETQPLYTSPMIQKTDYSGASSFADLGNALETAEIRIEADPSNLNITVKDKARGNAVLTTFRPERLNQSFKRLRFDRGAMQHVYGLGQQFKKLGSADGDWTTHGKQAKGSVRGSVRVYVQNALNSRLTFGRSSERKAVTAPSSLHWKNRARFSDPQTRQIISTP